MPNARETNPRIAHGWKTSPSRSTDKIQMVRVLDVSIVERCAAEAYFVHAIPNELKHAIDMILKKVCIIRAGLSFICVKANAEFSRYP